MKFLVTGGAGFIGSSFVRECLKQNHQVIVLDALTYAGHEANLEEVLADGRCQLVVGDISDRSLVRSLLFENHLQAIVHFAAESHVDNSIFGPEIFLKTNVMGTFHLLECAREYFETLADADRASFRFIQVSTDEVYGSLGDEGFFTEQSRYRPNSPYSASKAAADHLARAWFHTYGLPTITTNCSNNYGPRQFPEKLIPVMIQKGLAQEPMPVYGQGLNTRDWIHVEDHSRGVFLALQKGVPGETYCFGGRNERRNLELVESICDILDERRPQSEPHRRLISFVQDRAGHDWRYAIDDSKAETELGFERKFGDLKSGLAHTVDWYLANQDWIGRVKKKKEKV